MTVMSQERERVKKLVAALSELVNSVYVIKQPGESSPRIVVSNNALGKARRALREWEASERRRGGLEP